MQVMPKYLNSPVEKCLNIFSEGSVSMFPSTITYSILFSSEAAMERIELGIRGLDLDDLGLNNRTLFMHLKLCLQFHLIIIRSTEEVVA